MRSTTLLNGPTPAVGGVFPIGPIAVAGVGRGPQVRADGREVFVSSVDGILKSIALTLVGDTVTLGAPTTLFKLPAADASFAANGDGTQFVVLEKPFAAGQTLRMLTNWETRLSR